MIGAQSNRLPLAIGTPSLVSGAASVCSMYEIFAFYLQRGLIDVGFLGGAQIDRFGNINATTIGSYEKPKVRLPGSGGSAEIAAWANRTYIITPHQKRRFPERCDFITGAGFLNGRAQREAKGVRGGGPFAVVTDVGILEPNDQGELILAALHPNRTLDEARANTGWQLQVATQVNQTESPSPEELNILRELDPQGIYLKGSA